ncbi:MAG: tetratricopeptide repeat protein [Sphingomonadaceae bacterium]
MTWDRLLLAGMLSAGATVSSAWALTGDMPAAAVPVTAQASRGAADSALAPLSVSLVEKGRTLLAQQQLSAAADRFETALAVDPRNIDAYVGLAEVARAQGLPGKAVRFYREALAIDPTSRAALEGQGIAYLERGARPRAEANLERLKTICRNMPCPEANRLQSALAAPAERRESVAEAPPERASVRP